MSKEQKTHQVRLKHDSGIGYIALCESKNFKTRHHQKKSWALEEAKQEFPHCKLVEQGKDPATKDIIYLVVELPHAQWASQGSTESHPTKAKPELLLACPKCGQPNFTARGLRGHRCPKSQKDGIDLPLTKQEWTAAVQAAKNQMTFELLPAADAETEKKITGHVKVIRLAIVGNRRARNLFFTYAAVAGAHANALMELAPFGQGEKLLKQHFPDVAESTLKDWRQFATDLGPAIAKRPTVGLLTAPTLGKKAFPAKVAEAIQEAVMEIMDGQGMVKFMRSCRALREPEETGGDRGGHSGPRKPNAEEQREEANTYVADQVLHLKMLSQDKANLILCDTAKLNELEEARVALGRHIAEIKANRKTK